MGLARLRRRARDIFLHENWMIGWIDQPIENAPHWKSCPPVRWIGPRSKTRYLADPFPWPGKPNIVLCEDYDFQSQLGALRRLEIDGEVVRREEPVPLPLPGHLSYPFLFEEKGEVYLMPESGTARRLVIFRWSEADKAWREYVTPLPDTAAADSVLFKHEGLFWIAYTDIDLGAFDNLNLCYAPALEGPWQKHAGNPVKRDARSARGGGTPFRAGGKLYRPAQDCAEIYGGALRIMEILECSPDAFREREITFIPPERGMNPHGLHTLSACGGKCLVDGKRMTFSPRFFAEKVFRYARRLV